MSFKRPPPEKSMNIFWWIPIILFGPGLGIIGLIIESFRKEKNDS